MYKQMILVALATFDSELYVTFPGTVRALDFLSSFEVNYAALCDNPLHRPFPPPLQITPLEASTSADLLSRTLRQNAEDLFQNIQ